MSTDRTTRSTALPAPRTDASRVDEPVGAAARAAAPLAGAAMVAGAACLALAESVHVQVGGEWTAEAMLVSVGEHPGRWLLWSLLIMATGLLLLPGVVAWRTRAAAGPGRGRGLTTVGTTVLGAGLVGLFGFGGMHAHSVDMVGGTLPVPAGLVEAYTRADEGVGTAVTAGLALLCFHVGVPLFLAGLARARLLSWPVAVLGGVASVVAFVGGGLGFVVALAGFLVVAAVLAWLGVRLVAPGAGRR